jgi:N-acetylglucosaminyldiphosphoundecaprenol N-acetyl-beta-D-mannosaminyltransferase
VATMPNGPSFQAKSPSPSYSVLGVQVHCVQSCAVIAEMESWIESRDQTRYIAITGMHGVSESRRDSRFREILNSASLVVPDGMPLVWLARWHQHPLDRRVCGADLMEAFCQQTGSRYRHFFYGGAPGVAEDLAQRLRDRHNIILAGTYTPPFRPLTNEEENEVAARVRATAPDVIWVGLSTPKQERWMYDHRDKFLVPVMLGVGAAFDFNSGKLRRAPAWMGNAGLEWLFRLLIEPKRLWKRYLVTIPATVWSVSLEIFHLKKVAPRQRSS